MDLVDVPMPGDTHHARKSSDMAKKNRGNRSENSGNSSAGSGAAGPVSRKPHVRRSFIERLVAKSEDMFSLGADIAKMISGRNAPGDVEAVAKSFVSVLEQYHEKFIVLKDSGWAPAEAASKAEIKEGDIVTIVKSALPKYDFIEGLAEGRTKLVAVRFVPRGEGKVVDVLGMY